ncbi:hypothetical protein CRYUN_Cryun19dG0164800 [Craigia yunnanensis]
MWYLHSSIDKQRCFHSKKYLTGGFLSMDIFFWFPLSIALSAQSVFNTQYRRYILNIFIGSALLIQYPVKEFGKMPSRAELTQ